MTIADNAFHFGSGVNPVHASSSDTSRIIEVGNSYLAHEATTETYPQGGQETDDAASHIRIKSDDGSESIVSKTAVPLTTPGRGESITTVDDTKPVMTALRRDFVFKAGDCDADGKCYVDFRIPALKRTKSGALIAFAEASGAARNIAKGILDHGIVARISADGSGHNSSWGKIFKVAYAYPEANESFANPSPVVDLKTGTIFLHFCSGQEGSDVDFAALVTSSTDGGHTWGSRISLNTTLKAPGTGWYA